ncbi:MAG: sulfite exporter TauE/SafE family protein [Epsilonproteobacteria bacterium]|nr:MAG: sulfite exporter TauE/SafE family protein [Campylobacterota bacterium]RLA67169.1 MAG: sulfite exporter TauE/SafE family protein [Campylobacterota bacterium]
MDPIVVSGYVGALFVGLVLGLIGAGGSILILPILVYLLKIPPVLATAYSLFIVGLTALVGTYKYYKKDLVNLKTAGIFALPAFFGVFLTRKFLVPAIPAELFTAGTFTLTKDVFILLFFAVVMVLAAYTMIKGKKDVKEEQGEQVFNYPLIGLEGLIVGFVTGLVGAGGGFLIIPALVVLAKIPMKEAVGTSLLIIAAKSLFGFLGDIGGEYAIDWSFLGIFSSISIVGIFLGIYLNHYVPGQKLKKGFGFFVLAMGLFIIGKELFM